MAYKEKDTIKMEDGFQPNKKLVKLIYVYSDGSEVESVITDYTTPYTFPNIPNYPFPTFPEESKNRCGKCGIDLKVNTHYCCFRSDCPSRIWY